VVGSGVQRRSLPFVGEISADDLPRIALVAPGRSPLTYAGLADLVEDTARTLAGIGVERGDRVALVVPNGPEAASAFLGIAAVAACAPLNPTYPESELRFYLDDLKPAVLIIAEGLESAAPELAATMGIRTLQLRASQSDPAGAFLLTPFGAADGPTLTTADTDVPPLAPNDVALVLHTSGTTSRPKLVPLTHANLAASARSVGRSLELLPDDRCLNVMPMFHIHGLVAALLATLDTRGSVIAAPGFRAAEVADWVRQQRPTWYTAVPTIHQSMVRVAEQHDSVRGAFRFIRSSSAALPIPLCEHMERTFNAPVIEAYGMTEAAHQMASNSLPPAIRKPGAVGRAAGPEVAVMDADGNLLAAGETGEIVIRGASVTSGYIENPAANEAAFTAGWFRTGDRGVLDADGFLTITGRIKEIINRGGEKVAPREVEDVLLAHADVAEAVVFAAPHASLGEDVAAAVVLRDHANVSRGELRSFVGERVAPFKVPRQIVFVTDIPKGATGKLQRIGLAARLGMAVGGRVADPKVPLRSDAERRVADLFVRVLELDGPIGATDDFLDLGADSLHVQELLSSIEDEFHQRLPATALLESARVESLANMLMPDGGWHERVRLVQVQAGGVLPAVYCIMRASALVLTRNFRDALGPDRPIVGLWMPAMHGSSEAVGSIEEAAVECLDAIRADQPHGPYVLFGYSAGGIVAYEMAQRLIAAGERVELLALADIPLPKPLPTLRSRLRMLFSAEGPSAVAWQVRSRVPWLRSPEQLSPTAVAAPEWATDTDQPADLDEAYMRERRWQARPIAAPVVMFNTRESIEKAGSLHLGWEKVGVDGWSVVEVPGSHFTMLGEPHVQVLAARLAEALRET
jgi:acyl-CoA synthetase (AMP-forming)/AMP-acid ligase II/thioesterase domain-containing protein/acyl carrier protein